jgi:hypothetical protein
VKSWSFLQGGTDLAGVWYILVSLGVAFTWRVVLGGRHMLPGTTLMSAWYWTLAVTTAWTATWLADSCANAMSPAAADHAWYGCAVLALCPPISVLGARRPGTRVWAWFITLPMLLALGWPIFTLWLQGSEFRGLELETPQIVAFGLVLVMGVGNYCGTRFTLPALLYAAATLGLVACSSTASSAWLMDRGNTRFWCTALIAIGTVFVKTSRPRAAASRFDQLWFDFFDTFGLVWGRRIQDRVNDIAAKESWQTRLEFDGFKVQAALAIRTSSATASSGPSPDRQSATTPLTLTNEIDTRIEHTLRWLLRRFVDPQWIDQRLGSNSELEVVALAADS